MIALSNSLQKKSLQKYYSATIPTLSSFEHRISKTGYVNTVN